MKYAVGEVFLIMVGIFLALQLNNWNERSKDRLEEREIRQRIYADVTEYQAQVSGFSVLSTKANEALEQVEAAFEEGQVAGNVQFLTSVVESSLLGYSTLFVRGISYESFDGLD